MLSLSAADMNEPLRDLEEACPNCGSADNEEDATFCQACGARLGSALVPPQPPPEACEQGKVIADRFVVQSLLWSSPTYNAYDATVTGAAGAKNKIFEQQLTHQKPHAPVSPLNSPSAGH